MKPEPTCLAMKRRARPTPPRRRGPARLPSARARQLDVDQHQVAGGEFAGAGVGRCVAFGRGGFATAMPAGRTRRAGGACPGGPAAAPLPLPPLRRLRLPRAGAPRPRRLARPRRHRPPRRRLRRSSDRLARPTGRRWPMHRPPPVPRLPPKPAVALRHRPTAWRRSCPPPGSAGRAGGFDGAGRAGGRDCAAHASRSGPGRRCARGRAAELGAAGTRRCPARAGCRRTRGRRRGRAAHPAGRRGRRGCGATARPRSGAQRPGRAGRAHPGAHRLAGPLRRRGIGLREVGRRCRRAARPDVGAPLCAGCAGRARHLGHRLAGLLHGRGVGPLRLRLHLFGDPGRAPVNRPARAAGTPARRRAPAGVARPGVRARRHRRGGGGRRDHARHGYSPAGSCRPSLRYSSSIALHRRG